MNRFKFITLFLLMVGISFSQTDKGKTMLLSQRLESTDGKVVTLDQIKGEKGLVIIFWSNTCPWVKKYEARTVALIREYQKKGFGFVLVNSNDTRKFPAESLEEMGKKAQEGKYPCLYVKDRGSKLALALGAKRTPHVFVFNSREELVYQGAVDDNAEDATLVKKAYLKTVLDALLQAKPVPYASTKAIGCTIKFYKQID
ncbi:MAG: thioredoxin family protein [Methanobacteriota archaeon]|nr:MAG: thioredoxin family protein [Euryarchaeota archaeon]